MTGLPKLCLTSLVLIQHLDPGPQISNIKLALNMNQKQVNQEKKHQTTFKKKKTSSFNRCFHSKKNTKTNSPGLMKIQFCGVLRIWKDQRTSPIHGASWTYHIFGHVVLGYSLKLRPYIYRYRYGYGYIYIYRPYKWLPPIYKIASWNGHWTSVIRI